MVETKIQDELRKVINLKSMMSNFKISQDKYQMKLNLNSFLS